MNSWNVSFFFLFLFFFFLCFCLFCFVCLFICFLLFLSGEGIFRKIIIFFLGIAVYISQWYFISNCKSLWKLYIAVQVFTPTFVIVLKCIGLITWKMHAKLICICQVFVVAVAFHDTAFLFSLKVWAGFFVFKRYQPSWVILIPKPF